MLRYTTPGAYLEIEDTVSTQIDAGRVDIAAFIGMAQKGPLNIPTRVTSMRQFQTIFGAAFLSTSYLAYTVKAFFENGGDCCYIVRIGGNSIKKAQCVLSDASQQQSLYITAASEGVWGNDLSITFTRSSIFTRLTGAINRAPTTTGVINQAPTTLPQLKAEGADAINVVPTTFPRLKPGSLVRVIRDTNQSSYIIAPDIAQQTQGRNELRLYGIQAADAQKATLAETIEFTLNIYQKGQLLKSFSQLSLVPFADRFIETIINNDPEQLIAVTISDTLKNLFTQQKEQTLQLSPLDSLAKYLPLSYGQPIPLQEGCDGFDTLEPSDFIGVDGEDNKYGLRTLENIREVAIIAIPDIMPVIPGGPKKSQKDTPTVFSADQIAEIQQAMIAHCEAYKWRIALLDSPMNAPGRDYTTEEILQWRERFTPSPYAALYYPSLVVQDPLRLNGNLVRAIPPCGHVAGLFAYTDREKGVFYAPANAELRGIQDVNTHVVPIEHGRLNEQGINCIRVFKGQGVRVYGARTLATPNDTTWRYINIRRLFIMLERSIDALTQWSVFEPNDNALRRTLVVSITTFLERLWKKGAFVGSTATEAFFVKCDDTNNPPEITAQGQLIVEVGAAPSVPAEFVIVRFHRTLDTSDVTE